MRQWERLLHDAVESQNDLSAALDEALNELNISVSEFCEHSDLPESTVYKIKSGHRDNIQLNNFREIIQTLKRIEYNPEAGGKVVAVITNRESLEEIPNDLKMNDQRVSIHGYPCSTVEEAIRQSILAEKDGVRAIVCGPITAYTIESIVHVPVVGLDIRPEQVRNAVAKAIKKL